MLALRFIIDLLIGYLTCGGHRERWATVYPCTLSPVNLAWNWNSCSKEWNNSDIVSALLTGRRPCMPMDAWTIWGVRSANNFVPLRFHVRPPCAPPPSLKSLVTPLLKSSKIQNGRWVGSQGKKWKLVPKWSPPSKTRRSGKILNRRKIQKGRQFDLGWPWNYRDFAQHQKLSTYTNFRPIWTMLTKSHILCKLEVPRGRRRPQSNSSEILWNMHTKFRDNLSKFVGVRRLTAKTSGIAAAAQPKAIYPRNGDNIKNIKRLLVIQTACACFEFYWGALFITHHILFIMVRRICYHSYNYYV